MDDVSTKHLVEPDLLDALAQLPSFSVNAEVLPALREARSEAMGPTPEVPEIEVTEHTAPGAEGQPDVRMLLYTPREPGSEVPAILHIHGGGYVMGTPEMMDPANRLMARALNCVIASVDYRLAPETPHPGPVEDCYTGLRWLFQSAANLGVDPRRIAIKGESAGGGLAAGLGLLARDRGEFSLAFQHLTFPMLDDRESESRHPYVGEFVWTRESNRFGWQSLLGVPPGGEDVSPYAAAARADNLQRLPPTFIATGALDLFLEENLEYARRLTRAGVPTELHVYPGAYHGFMLAGDSRVGRQYAADSLRALQAALT